MNVIFYRQHFYLGAGDVAAAFRPVRDGASSVGTSPYQHEGYTSENRAAVRFSDIRMHLLGVLLEG